MDYQLGPGPLQVDQNTTDEKIKGDIGIVENGDIATHAILKDYYVIWKGNLYKAKTDISSGTTLSAESNGNLEPKSNGIGGEIAALNSKLTSCERTNPTLPSGITSSDYSYTKLIKHTGIKLVNVDFYMTPNENIAPSNPILAGFPIQDGNYGVDAVSTMILIDYTNNTCLRGYILNGILYSSSTLIAGHLYMGNCCYFYR